MVLGWRRPGRVGRCRIPQRKASDDVWGFSLCIRYVHLPGRLQSMCDIVLGVEIERALRAIQRDEGWNCKGAHSATIAIPGLGE